jgi:hypothetical protein
MGRGGQDTGPEDALIAVTPIKPRTLRHSKGGAAITIPEITLALFYVFNVVRGVMYLPQIARLARDPGQAQAICCATWAFWAGANATTAAYAIARGTRDIRPGCARPVRPLQSTRSFVLCRSHPVGSRYIRRESPAVLAE